MTAKPGSPQTQAKLQHAMTLHQEGRIEEAQAIYLSILKAHPKQCDCLHLLGVIALQNQNYLRAVNMIGKAINIFPGNPAFHSNLGNAFKELKKFDDAIASYDRAIAILPDFADAYVNRGGALEGLKRYDEAVASYDRAIAIQPGYAEAYYNRGSALRALNQHSAALASYDKAIALRPNYAAAHNNRAATLIQLEQIDAAVTSFNAAIAAQPGNAEFHFGRAKALHRLKNEDRAVADYEKAIAIRPDYAEAHHGRGMALLAGTHVHEAIASHDKAIAIKPDFAEAHYGRGMALHQACRIQEAIASYDATLAIEPDHSVAAWNKSCALLMIGEFAEGWRLFGMFKDRPGDTRPKRDLGQPLWLGAEQLAGKSLLLHSDQGLGDVIQYCRYAKSAAALGARVVLEAPKSLFGLLKDIEGVSVFVEEGGVLPPFDYYCPYPSLAAAFKADLTNIPNSDGYLRCDGDKIAEWAARLGGKNLPRVGIVWSGNPNHDNDHNRSIELSQLVSRLPKGFEYVSLQKDVRDADRLTLAANPHIRHFGAELNDFTDTAALCELMDVVVSVDTSVAHLAGALGKPTWILLPYLPDFRWLLDRNDSPWYASARLYRQTADRDWAQVLERVGEDLLAQKL